jgi:hypothetical protein
MKIAQIGDLDSNFFAHFAYCALLKCFSSFHETRQRAKHAGWKVWATSQQEFAAPGYKHHDRRPDPRVGKEAAVWAFHGEFATLDSRLPAASTAIAVIQWPIEELCCTPGESKGFGTGQPE